VSISDVSAAEKWIREACVVLGLQTDIKVIMITNRWRWTLEYEQDASRPDFSMNMIKLERALQAALKRPVDLRLEALSDKNRRKQRNVLREANKSK
jgi:hypothetical protein